MTMVNTVLGALVVLLAIGVHAFGPPAGPFDVKIDKLEQCEEEGTGQIHFVSKLKAVGSGKYIYDSPFYLGLPLDEHFKMHAEVQQWGNGGYKPRTMEHTIKNCEELFKFLGDFIKSIMKTAGVDIDHCPIPAGNYTAHNWEIDIQLKNIPTMTYNKYRGILTFFSKKIKVGCIIIYGETVPKGSLNG